MKIILYLIGISLVLAIFFLVLFIHNIISGQYKDTYSPAVRILFDDLYQKTDTKDESQEKP